MYNENNKIIASFGNTVLTDTCLIQEIKKKTKKKTIFLNQLKEIKIDKMNRTLYIKICSITLLILIILLLIVIRNLTIIPNILYMLAQFIFSAIFIILKIIEEIYNKRKKYYIYFIPTKGKIITEPIQNYINEAKLFILEVLYKKNLKINKISFIS